MMGDAVLEKDGVLDPLGVQGLARSQQGGKIEAVIRPQIDVVIAPPVEFQNELCFSALRAANVVRRLELWGDDLGLVTGDLYSAMSILNDCTAAIEVVRVNTSRLNSDHDFHESHEEDRKRLGDHIARAVIELDVLAARMKLDLGEIVVEKFNQVSRGFGAKTFIETTAPTDSPPRHEVSESRPVGDTKEKEKGTNVETTAMADSRDYDNFLHVYAQDHEHDDAAIVGDRKSLEKLRRQINLLLDEDPTPPEVSFAAMVADGEGFDVRIVLLDHQAHARMWNKLAEPYTAESARETREDAIQPYMLAQMIDEKTDSPPRHEVSESRPVGATKEKDKSQNDETTTDTPLDPPLVRGEAETRQCPPLVKGEVEAPRVGEKRNRCDTHDNSLQLTRGSDNEPSPEGIIE